MVPGSTYRLQLHKGFTFDDALAIADYLKALGVSHVYSSPYLQAAPNSMHGYDVVDHQRVNEELGGTPGHERFCKRLGDVGLGQVLDIVPNHMSLAEQNHFWQDVLANGVSSRYASFFDIDWNSPEERLRDKVLVPILGDQYGRALKDGKIKLTRDGSSFRIEVAGQHLPVSPQSMAPILDSAASYARNDTLRFLAASFGRLPVPPRQERRAMMARDRDHEVLLGLLERLCAETSIVCEAIDRRIVDTNADADLLDEFLNHQNYRLSYWKSSDQQLGYRRFFDVNTLIGLRMEHDYVFEETHALVVKWLKRGVLDGVRVDHPDGLRDPKQYFERLRKKAPEAWVVAEKILARGELLRPEWPVEGTSGYDFMAMVGGVIVSREGLLALGKSYEAFTGGSIDFPAVAHDKKIAVTQEALASDINRLTNIFVEICEANREYRDFTRAEVRRALREMVSCFGIYRTYVVPDREEISTADREMIEHSISDAKAYRQDIDGALFDFIRDVLTLRIRGQREAEFVLRFQQFTSPVMAKGVEDTSFYCYNRLVSMNEVGADPGYDGVSIEAFHAYNTTMQRTHPASMITLGTHDAKRSDDVRARLAVLTEVPQEFAALVAEWSAKYAHYRTGEWPDHGTEWFLYQTMIGAWPIDAERLKQYMRKAMREAKENTSWVAENSEYESALNSYIDSLLGDASFHQDIQAFLSKILHAGRINSLAQSLIKYTSPGVPDLYQGGEVWDLSLVDPDNRRPVDYAIRRRLLAQTEVLNAAAMMDRMDDGLPKLWVIHRALMLRRDLPQSFGSDAEYRAAEIEGPKSEHVIAYLRGDDVLTVVPRLTLSAEGWRDTFVHLPEGRWRNRMAQREYAGGRLAVAELFAEFPVALLQRVEAPAGAQEKRSED
jgi:(1->4)-alpha-D-glucan 1-alpha-D-glucosylmutase